jgi:hypothetical protein
LAILYLEPTPKPWISAEPLRLGDVSQILLRFWLREKRGFPGHASRGIPVLLSKIRVLVPDMAENHSIRAAMATISLGEENIIPVTVDAEFHMDQEASRRIIDQERGPGNTIMACVAYAGDPTCLKIDDLHGLAQILQDKDIWFHVDACHGSQLAFSKHHHYKLQGIEKADPITIDPQQTMLVPYDCSLVLFMMPIASIRNDSRNRVDKEVIVKQKGCTTWEELLEVLEDGKYSCTRETVENNNLAGGVLLRKLRVLKAMVLQSRHIFECRPS